MAEFKNGRLFNLFFFVVKLNILLMNLLLQFYLSLFNVTIFINLADNYPEMIIILSAHRDQLSYFELHSLLESYEIALQSNNPLFLL